MPVRNFNRGLRLKEKSSKRFRLVRNASEVQRILSLSYKAVNIHEALQDVKTLKQKGLSVERAVTRLDSLRKQRKESLALLQKRRLWKR